MLSFFFFFNIFIMTSLTKWLDDPPSNSCFNFKLTQDKQTNVCKTKLTTISLPDKKFKPKCVVCKITYFNVVLPTNCSRNFECVILYFDNNFIFERFFINHQSIIKSLFPMNLKVLSYPVIVTYVTYYNITKITNEYIRSILNIKFPEMIMFIKFLKRPQNRVPLTLENYFSCIKFKLLIIFVKCSFGSKIIRYRIEGHKINSAPLIDNRCRKNQSTKGVSNFSIVI